MTTVTSISQFNYLTKLSVEKAKKNRKGCDVIKLKSFSLVFNLDQSIKMLLNSSLQGIFNLTFYQGVFMCLKVLELMNTKFPFGSFINDA